MLKIKEMINKNERIFLIPLDHPSGEDTKGLSKKGIQTFVDEIEYLKHNGYIFHAQTYCKHPIITKKNFFVTIGEQPENYKLNLNKVKLLKTKYLTVFFEVKNKTDKAPIIFYKKYIKTLKQAGFIIMGMGYPEKHWKTPDYQIIANIAHQIGCDFFKTDLVDQLSTIDLHGMPLFIAGGNYLTTPAFKKFVNKTKTLKLANASFGRNIFESNDPTQRINYVLSKLKT